MKSSNIKTIYFDYDGTLHDSIKIYAPAFKKAYDFLVENNYAKKRLWRDEEIAKWLGYTSNEMWKNFMEEMENQILAGNAVLYDGALDVLKQLKNKGYNLIFLSNCSINYMELSNKVFNLNLFFNDMIC